MQCALAVQWLGLCFHSWVQSLAGELRSCKLCCTAEKQRKMNLLPALLPLHSQQIVYYCLVMKLGQTISMDCSPPASSVHRISQARILEWVAVPSPGDLLQPGIKLTSTVLEGRFFTTEPPGKPSVLCTTFKILNSFFFWKIVADLFHFH